MTKADIETALDDGMLDQAWAACKLSQYDDAFEYTLAVLALDAKNIEAHVLLLTVADFFIEANARNLQDLRESNPARLARPIFDGHYLYRDTFSNLADLLLMSAVSGDADTRLFLDEAERKSLLLLSRYAVGRDKSIGELELLEMVNVLSARLAAQSSDPQLARTKANDLARKMDLSWFGS